MAIIQKISSPQADANRIEFNRTVPVACLNLLYLTVCAAIAAGFRYGLSALRSNPCGGWASLPLHPNERISFYGCRTIPFLKGPGLDAALLLNLCGNHRCSSEPGYRERSAPLPQRQPATL